MFRKKQKKHLKSKIKHVEKNKLNVDSLWKNYNEFIKRQYINIKIATKVQKQKKHNLFTEEVNKIPLSPNDNKGIQLIDSVETYVCETNEETIPKKQEIKCNNTIKNTVND